MNPDDFVRPRTSTLPPTPIRVIVTGDLACFAPPHARVDAVSDPVMTPPAARRLLTNLYGKPEFEWMVRKIAVLTPIQYHRDVRRRLKSKGRITEFREEGTHTLRSTQWLTNVAYRIDADLVVNLDRADRGPDGYQQYLAEARERLLQGQQYHAPFLGRREALADYRLLTDDEDSTEPVDVTQDLGWMTLEMVPILPEGAGARGSVDRLANLPHDDVTFWARLDHGVLTVPVRRWKAEVLPRLFVVRNALPSTRLPETVPVNAPQWTEDRLVVEAC